VKHENEHFDLQAQLFNSDSCKGCYFVDTPCCMELVGTECSRGGNWVWIKIGDGKLQTVIQQRVLSTTAEKYLVALLVVVVQLWVTSWQGMRF